MQFLKKLAYNKCVLTRVKKCDKINTERREAVVVKKVIKALEKDGWVLVSQKGSHMKFKKDSKTCIVPNHKEDIPKGTLSQIVRYTGIKL